MDLASKIEAVLFYKAEPLEIKNLAHLLGEEIDAVTSALTQLEAHLEGRGVMLLQSGTSVSLGTHKEASLLIEEITKQELQKDLGKAGLETLTIVLYKAPVSKSEIDYIRGVNSGFILRNLLIRGLVSRSPHPIDKRAFIYKPTIELLSYLGISKQDELPEYKTIRDEVKAFEDTFKKEEEPKA